VPDGDAPDAVTDHVEASVDDVVDTARSFLAVDTANPPGHTDALADLVDERFRALGLRTERVAVDGAKPNVLATLAGARDRTLVFNGHLDTVPYGDDWTRDPLGERDGDRLYGRGATDMKGALAAMVGAAAAYAETDTEPPLDLCFAVVSDEETGGAAGLDAVLETRGLAADGCVIGETTCADGRYSVTVADRGAIWLTLEATGSAAHGSRPALGANAIDRLYTAIDHIRESLQQRPLDVDAALEPVVEDSVAYYASTMGEEAARRLFEHPTVNLGTFEGGDAVNTVPESARAEVDVRLTASVDTGAVLSDVRGCLAEHDGVSVIEADWSVGTYEAPDSPIVAATASVAEAVVDDHVYRRSATGGGDAKTLRNAGVPTVEFGVGTDTVHAVDEYTTVDALRENALVYAQLPYAFAAALED
jgi:succinyl-diaminopimelate desuccinylase